jgi:hypothetical protein
MTTNRDAYALAEKVATTTGRDAMAVVRWAARTAKSDRAEKIAIPLRHVLRRFVNGQELPRDFPDPVRLGKAVRLYDDYEGQHDM